VLAGGSGVGGLLAFAHKISNLAFVLLVVLMIGLNANTLEGNQ
jgi:hypothetical protein